MGNNLTVPRKAAIFIVFVLVMGLGVLAWLSRQPATVAPVPGAETSFPLPRVLASQTLDQISSITFRSEQRGSSFLCLRPAAHIQHITGAWLVSWPISSPVSSPARGGASPSILWPASVPAVESNFRSLSGIAGRDTTASSAAPLGTATFVTSGGGASSFTLLAPSFAGLPLMRRDGSTVALSADPAAIFDESTWQGMTSPLIAPLFGRDMDCITISDGVRTLILQRVYRQWEVSIQHVMAAGTAPLRGDLAACEGLAKVLSEATFESVQPGDGAAADRGTQDAKPAATVTLYRRGFAASDPHDLLEESTARIPSHRATLQLFRKGELDATTLSIASTLELVAAQHPPTTLGPVHGKVDPALLRHLTVDQWPFVSRVALEYPASDVTKVHMAGRTYTRPLVRWQASPPNSDPQLDPRVRNLLLLLSLEQADSVFAAPSQMPSGTITLRLEIPHFKREVLLEVAISPGEVLVREGARGLTYTGPSTVAEITSFLRR